LEIVRDRPRLWEKTIGSHNFAIRLSFTNGLHHEGDLQLEFQADLVPLYHLSFTIAPGYLVGSEAAQVILIARVQGVVGKFDAIRHGTKTCLDVAPPHLLMAAVQGVSDALNIDIIAGIRNKEQLTANIKDRRRSRNVCFDYDAFWRTYSGAEGEKFYLIPVPIPDKPLELINSIHRRRTRLKRQFKSEVTADSKAALRTLLAYGNKKASVRTDISSRQKSATSSGDTAVWST